MRILIVHNTLNDSTSVSGVLKHYALMANRWIELGHQTDFLVAKAGFPQLKELAPKAGLVSSDNWFDGTKYLSRTWRYFPAFGWRLAASHWLRLRHSYDVIYASSFLIFEVYAANVLARRTNSKRVVKIQHVLHSQPKRHDLFDRLFLWTERVSAKLAVRSFDRIMCLSQVVANDLISLTNDMGLPNPAPVTIGCGLDFSRIQDGLTVPKEFDAVFLGRMHEQKGVFELPRVWKGVVDRLPNARLIAIGEGPHRAQTELMCSEIGIRDNVEFTGGIGEDRKNELLAKSRVAISLSYEEGWGLSVTEFLATGLPVVAYDLPVFRRVFPNQLRMVGAGQVDRVAAEIIQLLEDDDLRHELGRRGRDFVRRYDYKEVADQEMDLLKSAVSGE